ncbi:MAG: AmmeMemoRadiSam system protein A [Dissulfurimicrobium sp.]|uniref:AmmeMemoRadiSam system protein A n=1 Tax=Dissulfurimicrobium TaxID=1769732 RepID=UPI001EDA0375|nr:AmmeMemoRadiSam system protein A [Dissulfurimicrobium hydrothermale]UKL14378.1 AmmeMemoRadiSam system protein A [Dissulfurimicrobium hydrothermale]
MTQIDQFSKEERRFLLELARKTIDAKLKDAPLSIPIVREPRLQRHSGVFVTLHKHGNLRGCIGTFVSNKPLYEQVMDMAISSAFHDPRFRPLTSQELKEIDIEISVLSPLRLISSINEIEIGTHGIYIISGPYSGVLLPQVATEYGWDRLTFLDQTCLKAGLAPGCWKDPATKIYIFSADIFSEQSEGLSP